MQPNAPLKDIKTKTNQLKQRSWELQKI